MKNIIIFLAFIAIVCLLSACEQAEQQKIELAEKNVEDNAAVPEERIAEQAIELGTGARGLRSVIEDVMLEIMYDIPSREDVEECIISGDVINKKIPPVVITGKKTKIA